MEPRVSLVERAAKRLEEMGKAGLRESADLVSPSSRGEAAASVSEHAVPKTEAPDARGGSRQTPLLTRVAEAPSSARGDTGDRAVRVRREPKLGDALAQVSTADDGPLRSRGALRPAQRMELDLAKLASVGYLDREDPESIVANEFRKIKRPLIKACQGKLAAPVENANRIMVTSSVPGEGKSFFALNLALSIATERDTTVLLIDADTTRYSLSRFIGIDSRRGLLDLLGDKQVPVSDALLQTNVEGLTLLPVGARRHHATELLASEVMEDLVAELASRYTDRILIFDTPPLLGAPEPAVLATHMGQVIVVVEADKTTHKVLKNALITVQSCPVVTTILNKTSRAGTGYYYYAA